MCDGLASAASGAGVPLTINREGSLFSAFFSAGSVADYESAAGQDAKAFASFFHALLGRGISIAPSAFEAWFVGAAHTDEQIERTLEVAVEAFGGARVG